MSEKTMHDIANEAVDLKQCRIIMDKQHERIIELDSQLSALKLENEKAIDRELGLCNDISNLYVKLEKVTKERDEVNAEVKVLELKLKLLKPYYSRRLLESNLSDAVKALEFYGNPKSWRFVNSQHDAEVTLAVIDESDTVPYVNPLLEDEKYSLGGKLARETLQRIKGT